MEISDVFRGVGGRAALMAHLYFGDPTEKFSILLAKALEESGADILEIGMPFSDPIADGPMFISACERALKAGVTPRRYFQGIRRLREEGVDVPIVVTTYYNIPFSYGVEKFVRDAKEAGAQGLIVPDLPVEEAGDVVGVAGDAGVDVIFLVAPTTSEERMKKIVQASSGFVYVVNVEGVTGGREVLPPSTVELIKRVKGMSEKPVMAGFGISREEQVRALVSAGADGVIIGSAIAEIYARKLEEPESTIPGIKEFMGKMRGACLRQ
ncbi:MAG: tryptophan synthase subunit alpha [Candidatus Hadarchaeales archaeon]